MRFFLSLILPLLQTQPADSIPNFDLEDTVDKIANTRFEVLLQQAGAWLWDTSIKLAICVAVFWVAKKLINFVSILLRKVIDRRRVDRTAGHFLINLLRVILWLIVVWILVSVLEVDTASIVALFASAGLAFGLALSGTLQNFAGGIMLLLFKPFRVGDYIYSQGEEGTVEDITIINTMLSTPDNRVIYLPNGATFSGIIRNTSKRRTRRVEWTFGIGYSNDYEQAKALLLKLIAADPRILTDPAPFIAMSRLGQNNVDIVVRVWVKSDDFWGVFYDMNEVVYKTFPVNELAQPSPQMDIYLHPVREEAVAPPAPGTSPSAPEASPQEKNAAVAEAREELKHTRHHCDASAKPSGGEGGG